MQGFRKKDLLRRPVERIVKSKNLAWPWSWRLHDLRGQLLNPNWMKCLCWEAKTKGTEGKLVREKESKI